MGHVFTLTDGTTTISLVASGVLLDNYAMSVPEGDDVTVVDTVDIMVEGASGAAMQSKARAIEAMMDAATRYHRTRTGARVFVTAQLISDADAWRSEIVGGRLEPADDTLAVWANNKARMTLYIERAPYWEGPETQIPLTNGNGTNNTAGLTVYNANDGSGTSPNKRNNYLQIAATDVVGVLPAPVKLELKNATGIMMQVSNMHLATNAFSDPANLAYILEAESRTGGGTVTADGAASGGSKSVLSGYVSGAWIYWNIEATLLQKTQGRWFRALVSLRSRTATAAQAETMQAELRDSTGVNVLFRGPEVAVNERATAGYPLVDLGALPMPPGSSAASFERVQLWITLRLASGTATTAIDFVQLTPTDSYMPLQIMPIGIMANDIILYDGIDGASYVTANGFKGPYLRTASDPLVVYPGKLQRISVLASHDDTPYYITDKWAVRAWYRPRRLSI